MVFLVIMTSAFEKMYHTWEHFNEKFNKLRRDEYTRRDKKFGDVMRELNADKERKRQKAYAAMESAVRERAGSVVQSRSSVGGPAASSAAL